jgi:hypothetical protein
MICAIAQGLCQCCREMGIGLLCSWCCRSSVIWPLYSCTASDPGVLLLLLVCAAAATTASCSPVVLQGLLYRQMITVWVLDCVLCTTVLELDLY